MTSTYPTAVFICTALYFIVQNGWIALFLLLLLAGIVAILLLATIRLLVSSPPEGGERLLDFFAIMFDSGRSPRRPPPARTRTHPRR